MKTLFLLLLTIWGLGITGCRTVAPVSHTIEKEVLKDSTVNIQRSTVDSSSRIESVTEKTLPGATAECIHTVAEWDSLTRALGQLPKETKIIVQDPKLRAQLKFYRDSLNRIHIECTATEQKYFEKTVEQKHYIEKLVNELTKVNTEKKELEKEVLQAKQPFWQKVKYLVIGSLLVLALILSFVVWLFFKMKLR